MGIPYVAAVAATVLLVACGGGGGDLPSTGAPLLCAACTSTTTINNTSSQTTTTVVPATGAGSIEGYWEGSASGYAFGTLVLADGTTYVAYSRSGTIEGVMFGTTSASPTTFSGALTDYNGARLTVTRAMLSGTYAAKSSLAATLKVGSLSYAPTGIYNQAYDSAVNLVDLAGTWTGSAASKDGLALVTFTVSASGAVSGATALCTLTGDAVAITSGEHPLRLTVSFDGVNCPLSGHTVSGVAIATQNGTRQQLLAMGLLADKSDGFFALATR